MFVLQSEKFPVKKHLPAKVRGLLTNIHNFFYFPSPPPALNLGIEEERGPLGSLPERALLPHRLPHGVKTRKFNITI